MLRICFVFCLLMHSFVSNACVTLGKNYSLVDLLESSDNIFLGELTSASANDGSNVFLFKVIESFKGNIVSLYDITVDNRLPGLTLPPNDSGRHTDYSFWTHSIGNTTLSEDCIVRPSFLIGHRYLILDGGEDSTVKYELISTDTDKWLAFVRNYFSTVKTTLTVLNSREFLSQFSSIHEYDCPSRPIPGHPVLKRSYRGTPPIKGPHPSFGYRLCNQYESYLYLEGVESKPSLTVPVKSGVVNISSYTKNVELLPNNKFQLGFLVEGN